MTGVEQKDAVVQQLELAQRRAVLVRADQLRQHLRVVVARIAQTPRDQGPEIVLEFLHRVRAAGDLVGGRAGLQSAQNRERPAPERGAFGARDAQHVADQLDRQRRGEVADQVAGPPLGDGVQHLVDHRLDPWLERPERAGGEGRHQPLPDPGVIGRVVEHQARRVVLVERRLPHRRPEIDRLVRRVALGVVIDFGHVGVAGEEHRPVFHPLHRRVPPERVVGRERVVEKIPREAGNLESVGELPVAHGRRLSPRCGTRAWPSGRGCCASPPRRRRGGRRSRSARRSPSAASPRNTSSAWRR